MISSRRQLRLFHRRLDADNRIIYTAEIFTGRIKDKGVTISFVRPFLNKGYSGTSLYKNIRLKGQKILISKYYKDVYKKSEGNEMAHLVITIGCEYGAKGNQIGKKVAKDLGIKFYDRDTVDEIIKEVGIPKDIMEKVEEGITIAGKGAEGDVRGSFSKYADLTERAIHVQKTIIRKLSDRESCVIIGRSADYILKEHKPILRIFIYSPDEVRIENVMKSHNLSEDDAKLFITEKDKRYHKRHMALTGSNRGDRHNRDMLIDSSLLGVDGTAELIESLARKVVERENETEAGGDR